MHFTFSYFILNQQKTRNCPIVAVQTVDIVWQSPHLSPVTYFACPGDNCLQMVAPISGRTCWHHCHQSVGSLKVSVTLPPAITTYCWNITYVIGTRLRTRRYFESATGLLLRIKRNLH